MTTTIGVMVTVLALGQSTAVNYTRNAGQPVAVFVEFPATQYGASQFARVDWQIVPPKDAQGLAAVSLGSSGHKDFALDGGKCTYALQPDGTVKGQYTATMGAHAGKALQLIFVCQRPMTAQPFAIVYTAYDSNGVKVDLDAMAGDTLTIRAQNPAIKVSLGNAQ